MGPAPIESMDRSRPTVAFLFKAGRRSRLQASAMGPREFFYGLTELAGAGFRAELVEEADLGEGLRPRWFERVATAATHTLAGLNANSVNRICSRRGLAVLNRYDAVVATTNSQGRSLALARVAGRLRPRVLLLAMGTLSPDAPLHHRIVHVKLLRALSLAAISRPEETYLRFRLGPRQDVDYLPFGIDDRFWSPASEDNGTDEYVLSIGNDANRDYATLAAAWCPDYPPLKTVTRLDVPASDGDIEVVTGDWNSPLLSDQEIRNLIQGARFVILPLRQTMQPSGQSACLQAMACGKAVILSDIDGLWDRDVMVDGVTCLLVPPGSIEGLQAAVQGLLDNPGRARDIGARARAVVENDLNLDIMASAMERRLNELLERATSI